MPKPRAQKRAEAEARNTLTPPERRRAARRGCPSGKRSYPTERDARVELVGAGVDRNRGRILDALSIALGRRNVPARSVFTYMCGITRNWLREIDEHAQLLIDGEVAVDFPTADDVLVDFIDRFGRGFEAA